jgi:DNA-binding winged helix-turn-helix (wHTH) protein
MSDSLFLRRNDLDQLKSMLADGASCSIVGLSNVGKSALLRAAASEPAASFIAYVDCNLMLALSDQAFYEVTLRSALDALRRWPGVEAEWIAHVEKLYRQVIDADRPGTIIAPLAFNEAIAFLCEKLARRVALLFDEFDDPFGALEGRVFLNLRALHDKYESLVYVTATGAALTDRRHDVEAGEFCELFAGRQIVLGMPADELAQQAMQLWAKEDGADLDQAEKEFILAQAGRHPALLQAATHLVVRVASGAPIGSRVQALGLARDRLESDSAIRSECAKLWAQLPPLEQDALLNLLANVETPRMIGQTQAELVAKGILVDADPPRIFSELFAAYVRRQRKMRQPAQAGVWVDVDAGEVWIDGEHVPSLTDLEYRLLLLLYGRSNKICDKYQIVEAVWGQDYIDEVDDARIEKLISRLRSKLERDAANPKYLLTVRGRGYKLAAA